MSDDNKDDQTPEQSPETAVDADAASAATDEKSSAGAPPVAEFDVEKEPVGEMVDRNERRAQKKAAREKALAERKAKAEPDEIDKALSSGKLGEKKKEKRKKQFKMAGMAAAGIFVIWLGSFLFAPYQAGLSFGICKVYLENSVRFPKYLRLSTVEDFGDYIRIWYTQLDSFGEYRMENIQCHYVYDEERGTIIDKILIDRREVDKDKVERFNQVIPLIASNPPDLTYPAPLPDSLRDLQIDSDRLRFQLGLPSF